MADTDIEIPEFLLKLIDRKKEILEEKRPLPPGILNRLREEFRLQHTFNSNAIEGNTLTLLETKIVMEERITIGGKTIREHLEVIGTAGGFDLVWDYVKPGKKIDENLIKILHKIVTSGILESPGTYRTLNVVITGVKKRPPDHSSVPGFMNMLIKDINQRKEHPVIVASFLHHRFVAIHPFEDGNGRVGRLLTNFFLMANGYPPIVLRKSDRKRYYSCLKAADDGDMNPIAKFIALAVNEALSIYLTTFGREWVLVPLRELAKSSPYSQEYLSLRARQGELDAVKIGYVWHSSRMALQEYLERVKAGRE
jgi:Fic family protein